MRTGGTFRGRRLRTHRAPRSLCVGVSTGVRPRGAVPLAGVDRGVAIVGLSPAAQCEGEKRGHESPRRHASEPTPAPPEVERAWAARRGLCATVVGALACARVCQEHDDQGIRIATRRGEPSVRTSQPTQTTRQTKFLGSRIGEACLLRDATPQGDRQCPERMKAVYFTPWC